MSSTPAATPGTTLARIAACYYAKKNEKEFQDVVKLAKANNPKCYTFFSDLAHLLDEAPLPVIVMAVEEAASREHVPPRTVWRSVGKLAKSLSVHRQGLWA